MSSAQIPEGEFQGSDPLPCQVPKMLKKETKVEQMGPPLLPLENRLETSAVRKAAIRNLDQPVTGLQQAGLEIR